MTTYRRTSLRCPTCAETLEEHQIAEPAAMVDLCPKCGGVWLDWEDGDFTELAREIPPARVREIPRGGPGSCPRCHKALSAELFQDMAEVLRCTDCAGAFLPYASIGKIAAGTPADARAAQEEGLPAGEEGPEDPGISAAEAPLPEGTWARIVHSVRQWLGPSRA